ncbi:hypothetical protein [Bacillus cereus]|nr:hypothetical protein [Bacillus cereus]WCT67215.1 hypothetical protein PRK74_29365 [Bacillus cereus]
MKDEKTNISSEIGTLTTPFYVHQDSYMEMTNLEFYVKNELL